MAKKSSKKDEANERAVDIDSLEPALRKSALHLGFRSRASINKVTRGIEHEKWTQKLSWGFVAFMALVAAVFGGLRFVVPEERQGHFLLICLFAAAWSFLSWLYVHRARKRQHGLEELLAVVKERLGK